MQNLSHMPEDIVCDAYLTRLKGSAFVEVMTEKVHRGFGLTGLHSHLLSPSKTGGPQAQAYLWSSSLEPCHLPTVPPLHVR